MACVFIIAVVTVCSFLDLVDITDNFRCCCSASTSYKGFCYHQIYICQAEQRIIRVYATVCGIGSCFSCIRQVRPFLYKVTVTLVVNLIQVQCLPISEKHGPFIFFSGKQGGDFSAYTEHTPTAFHSVIFRLLQIRSITNRTTDNISGRAPRNGMRSVYRQSEDDFVSGTFIVISVE